MTITQLPRHGEGLAIPRPISSGRGPIARRLDRDATSAVAHIDWILAAGVVLQCLIGLVMINSASHKASASTGTSYVTRQAMALGVGFVATILICLVDYRRVKKLAAFGYLVSLLLLGAVVTTAGTTVNGAQAWFDVGGFQLQPSEFAKLALIFCLALFAARSEGELGPGGLVTCLVITGVPLGLILLQPDLGTGMVFVFVLIGILVVAGASLRWLGLLSLVSLAAIVAVFSMGLLKQYQIDRLTVFLNPDKSETAASYNLEQSMLSIASGGFAGKGINRGDQTRLDYVPEQRTDFIFTVIGEELGFVGSISFLFLQGLILWRVWRASQLAPDLVGTLLCVGVLAMFAFQLFENVGMTMGIMPITGIPLPLVSYGGSSALVTLIALALVQNVHMRHTQVW